MPLLLLDSANFLRYWLCSCLVNYANMLFKSDTDGWASRNETVTYSCLVLHCMITLQVCGRRYRNETNQNVNMYIQSSFHVLVYLSPFRNFWISACLPYSTSTEWYTMAYELLYKSIHGNTSKPETVHSLHFLKLCITRRNTSLALGIFICHNARNAHNWQSAS